MRIFIIAILAAAPISAPLMAQSHHQGHDQSHTAHRAPETKDAAPEVDHSTMDHSAMGHEMDHSAMGHAPAQSVPASPSPNNATGPITAADAIWGADAMRESRAALYKEHGDMQIFWFQGDRLEYRARAGRDGYLWDVQGYYGGDINKLWFKSEGEGSFGEKAEQAEVQALYSRAIAPFFDLQAGIRQDFAGPANTTNRTHAAIGIQGLMPYMFEIDAAAFLSHKGDLTARIEAEYDQRISDRLILQPRAEMSLSAQNIPELGIGAGIDSIELGMRLRYEIKREFAPYIGIEQEWKIGDSADYTRLAGDDPGVTNYVVGVRFWF